MRILLIQMFFLFPLYRQFSRNLEIQPIRQLLDFSYVQPWFYGLLGLPCLVGDVRAEVPAYDAMPGGIVLFVKLLLDVRGDILLDVVLLKSLRKFLITVCPGSSDPFYIASLLQKMGHYFLDIL